MRPAEFDCGVCFALVAIVLVHAYMNYIADVAGVRFIHVKHTIVEELAVFLEEMLSDPKKATRTIDEKLAHSERDVQLDRHARRTSESS